MLLQELVVNLVKRSRLRKRGDHRREAVRQAFVAVNRYLDARGAEGVGVREGLVAEDIEACDLDYWDGGVARAGG